MFVALLVISFIIIAYFIYKRRRPKNTKANAENKSKERDQSKDIYENNENVDENYVVHVEIEQFTYAALKRPGERENDDHVYCHLNKVHQDKVNPKRTGIQNS